MREVAIIGEGDRRCQRTRPTSDTLVQLDFEGVVNTGESQGR